MAHHALPRNATQRAPLFSRPTTTHAVGIPRWTQLDAELQQALVCLLTEMIGNHLPGSRARAGKGDADDRRC
jgi:hypothetical protein